MTTDNSCNVSRRNRHTTINRSKIPGSHFRSTVAVQGASPASSQGGTSAALGISGITKCNEGPPYKYMQQLFQAIIAPYAAII